MTNVMQKSLQIAGDKFRHSVYDKATKIREDEEDSGWNKALNRLAANRKTGGKKHEKKSFGRVNRIRNGCNIRYDSIC